MDAQRFDALTKALATRTHRRSLLKGVLGGTATALMAYLRPPMAGAQDSPPIQPSSGTSAAEPDASTIAEIDYFAIGDSIASGHGLLDHDGPDPDVAPNGFLLPTCRDCDSDQCRTCESPDCDPCRETAEGLLRTCTGKSCRETLKCGPCCRRSKLAYPYKVRNGLAASFSVRTFQHLACTGATSLSPITLDDIELTITSPVPPEELLITHHRNGMRLLRQQVDRAISGLESAAVSRPTLVSITIGANDMEFARADGPLFGYFSKAGERLLRMKDDEFARWARNRTAAVNREVSTQIRKLLAYERVVVVLTEVPNPFSNNSVLFNVPLGWCNGKCYPRVELAASLLNAQLHTVVDELGKEFPDRIAIAPIHDQFEHHKGAKSACGTDGPEVGTPSKDQAPRSIGTWIQHPEEITSNSYSHRSHRQWSGDCVHPNEDGAKFIARSVLDLAMPMVQSVVASTTPPVITSDPALDGITDTSAIVAWTTDVPTVGVVEYGLTRKLGRTRPRKPGEPSTDHRVELTSLDPGTPYFFRVRSTGDGGEAVSEIDEFTTAGGCAGTGDACAADADCCEPSDHCRDGACVASHCAATEAGTTCSPYPDLPGYCSCQTTLDGRGFCAFTFGTNASCKHIPACASSDDCADGQRCVVVNCPGVPTGCLNDCAAIVASDACRGLEESCAWDEVCCSGVCADGRCAGAAVPQSLIGSWAGSGTQDDPPMDWPITMTLYDGGIGTIVGDVDYPSLGCTSTLTLVSVPSADAIEARESITSGSGTCVDRGTFVVTHAEGGFGISFRWTSPDGASTASGSLSPSDGADQSGQITVWAMACPSTTDTSISVITQGNVDPGPACRGLGDEISLTIYDDAGAVAATATGGSVLSLPFGDYLVVDDASGASTTFTLDSDATYGSCTAPACLLVIVSVPYTTGQDVCDGEGTPCTTDGDCCQGEFCLYLGYCTRICADDSECASGLVCCTNRNPPFCTDSC